ncbi:DUF1801 domain-containing protein [Luteimonas sp. MC1750]|uniref:DUF1801 domain-containing protein n=1 Tax=Luteimonas sp. MC1750 TaxID=2799326 RepID=UPI0018F0FBBA|nr:DUF1801 domain-containing protein [Luteimonas sp. MC1750]MBJ6985625.1 DUF1801 domain-containing protein [Luteimonas sp. MC1750]QQO06108.1 DUF1801 domain-containing protein [Luteimonas sp. MC1750]
MAENRTRPTDASVVQYLDANATRTGQRADAEAMMALMARITGEPATLWGPSIVGFGRYRYTYASGRSGEAPLAGFAVRGRDLVVYLDCEDEGEAQQALLARLGRHRMGKSCLYIRQLADVDLAVLEALVHDSIAQVRQRYG